MRWDIITRREEAEVQMQSGTFVPNPIKPRNYPEEFIVVRAVVNEGVRQASRIFKISLL